MLERISKFVAGIVEGRDPDLGGHHKRLGENALAFAKHIGCSAEEMEVLSVGARIHDLGKLSISEHILNKPARLTAAEFSLVKQHTQIGFQLLDPLGLDPRISEIVHYHHENFDGSGYPTGLAGAAIPLLARMTRIWDSYDALTMDRPYHQGVSSEEALQLLQRDSHFYDPDLLKEFCAMVSINNMLAAE
jgi:putative nucleotidyltransferase with HDIG domain